MEMEDGLFWASAEIRERDGMEGTEVNKCEQAKKVRAEEKRGGEPGRHRHWLSPAVSAPSACWRDSGAPPKLPSRGFHSLCVCAFMSLPARVNERECERD